VARRLRGLLRQARGDAEVDDAGLVVRRVDHDVVRLDILVNDAEPVERIQGIRERGGDLQGRPHVEPPRLEQVVERRGAEILQDQREAPAAFLEGIGLADAGQMLDSLENAEFTLQPRKLLRGGIFVPRHLDRHTCAVGIPVASVKNGLGAFVAPLRKRVIREIDHIRRVFSWMQLLNESIGFGRTLDWL
jgi:hypothetical protein